MIILTAFSAAAPVIKPVAFETLKGGAIKIGTLAQSIFSMKAVGGVTSGAGFVFGLISGNLQISVAIVVIIASVSIVAISAFVIGKVYQNDKSSRDSDINRNGSNKVV